MRPTLRGSPGADVEPRQGDQSDGVQDLSLRPSIVQREQDRGAVRTLARDVLLRSPRLFSAWTARRGEPQASRLVRRDTDVVIEGFARSANTFAHAAFEMSQQGPLRIAHHLHAPAQVLLAVRYGIPTILLVRRGPGAAASLAIRTNLASVRQPLRDWIAFHEPLVKVLDQVVVAPFDVVVRDFGRVIDALNTKYGATFAPFEHTADAVDAVFAVVEERDRRDSGGNERMVARPSEARDDLRERYAAEIEDPELAPLVTRADALYERMVSSGVARR